jgi:ABC-type antimicrobial peptide transport system permease subunit
MILDTARMYDTAIAHGATFGDAALRALVAFFGLGLAYGIMGGMLFLMVTVFTSVVIPDVMSGARAVNNAVRRTPAAWQRFRDNTARATSRLRQATVALMRYLTGVPVRIRAMTARDWLFTVFFVLSLAILALLLWLTWGWAGAVVAWLPDWLVDGKGWFVQLIVAWFICMIPWSVSMSVLSAIVKALIRRKNGR